MNLYRVTILFVLTFIGWTSQCFALFLPSSASIKNAFVSETRVEQIVYVDNENRVGKIFTIGYTCTGADSPEGSQSCRVKWVHCYDVASGSRVFLSTDPLDYVDGMNMYAYVMGNVVNATDPMGLVTLAKYQEAHAARKARIEKNRAGIKALKAIPKSELTDEHILEYRRLVRDNFRAAGAQLLLNERITYMNSAVEQWNYYAAAYAPESVLRGDEILELDDKSALYEGISDFYLSTSAIEGLSFELGGAALVKFASKAAPLVTKIGDYRKTRRSKEANVDKQKDYSNHGGEFIDEMPNSQNVQPFKGLPGKLTRSDYLEIKTRTMHNTGSDTLILGKYRPTVKNGVEDWSKPGPDSYNTIARNENATFFDLGNEWDVITSKYDLTPDDMFDLFNIPVLDDAVRAGKQIKFSHDPRVHGGFLKQEWDYLQKTHGFTRLREANGVWYAK